MPNGFGFAPPGQRPSPDPRQVGQMLASGGQPEQGPAQPVQGATGDQGAALRRAGARLMGGGGPDDDGALAAAVGEHLTRQGNVHSRNPNPFKDRASRIRHLTQLGISETEAMFLGETL